MNESRSIVTRTIVVILAAGKGTRMGRSDLSKVCFEIDGVPAINGVIATFKSRRFEKYLVVVGDKAQQVLEVVGQAHPGVMYTYQHPQLGTGHAAQAAAEALQNLQHDGYVLLTTGDKYIEAEAIETLVAGYIKQRADMALLTLPKSKATEASVGRVLVDPDGQALDIIEANDRARQAILEELDDKFARTNSLTGSGIRSTIQKYLRGRKAELAVPAELLSLAEREGPVPRSKLARILQAPAYRLEIDGRRYSASELEKACLGINPSLYLFRAEVFYHGLRMIERHDPQGEYYVTDVVRRLGAVRDDHGRRQYRIRAVAGGHGDWVQGFNSPDELLAIQDYVRRKRLSRAKVLRVGDRPRLKANQYGTVRQWLTKLEDPRPPLRRWLSRIYGQHEDLHRRKCADLRRVLCCYGRRFGYDQKVCIVRAPGRINLMGRHVDHRGGWTNFLAIDRETLAVAGLREDNDVLAVNAAARQFKPVHFNISELIGRFAWSDWINFVNSDWVRAMLYSALGDWGNYIKAAMLRLQHRYQDVKVRGINLAVYGDVPIAAGLSSSSTIVVATLQAAIAVNNFELTTQQFIDLCGEGEWFVGSRGGAGDHAAIYLGQRGKIAHVGYLPFRLERMIDAPGDYQVLIANSHIRAAKSGGARDTFNARIADYNLGLALLKQRCPEIAHAVCHLRDLNPTTLGCTTSDIYRMLLKVPVRVTRRQYRAMLPGEHRELLEANFATHREPDFYQPRGVLLFGAAEIIRAAMCVELLAAGEVEQFGQLMRVSHDGDRVARPAADGTYRLAPADLSDDYLRRLLDDLAGEDPQRVLRAQLYLQPGCYACSTPEIDEMVDIATQVPGVAGAQIAGAGLGGCIMVLAEKASMEAVRRALTRHYYHPRKLRPSILPCIAVEGAGLAEF